MARRWGPIVTGVALVLTFAILVGLGTISPPGTENAAASGAGGTPAPSWMRTLRPGEKPPQFVLFSFDGAGSHDHWRRVLPIAKKANAHVTAFLSGVYLLPDSRRTEYTGPGHRPGRASIGFGGTEAQVATRIRDLNDALAAGHEIGTHYNGHFCAGNEPSVRTWHTAQWATELDEFFAFVRDADTRGLRLNEDEIRGGRTPCLEGDLAALTPTLAAHGLDYDSSDTAEGMVWPRRHGGVWEFPVPVVRVPALHDKRVVMADYNLWYAMNGAREQPARDKEFTAATLDTYRAAYQAARNTNRAPLVVDTHFNDWSGGAFSEATERFMAEICVRDQTVCTTYSQVIKWMRLQDPKVLDRFRAMPPAQVS